MGDRYHNESKLADKLLEYSQALHGEIAELTYRASLTIDTLVGRLKTLERQIEQMEDEK